VPFDIALINAIFPVVILAACGWLARATRLFSEAETNTVERLAFWFLLPCLLFYGTATAQFPAILNWHYLLGFYGVLLGVYALGMGLGRLLFGFKLRELSVFGMAGAYSNVTILGIPITLQVLGEQALVPMLVIITVHNLIIYTLGTVLAELEVESGSSLVRHVLRIGKEMLLNPISGSLLAGAAWNFFGPAFPAAIAGSFELLRPAAIPASLFALGAGLHRYHIRGALGAASVIVLLKLLLMPMLTWWVLHHWLQVDLLWARTATMLSAMPVGVSVYVFSRRYQSCETAVATAIVLSSLGAVASIALCVGLMGL
jgi:malonate transporter